MSNGGDGPPGDPINDAVDEGLGAAIGALPEDSGLKKFAKEAGVGGLVLGVLMGNIPVAAAVASAASGKGALDSSAIAVYFDVFKLVTPWVAVFGVIAYCVSSGNYPQISGAGLCFLGAGLIFVAATVSYSLGGPVPAEVTNLPTEGGPTAAGAYAINSLNAYIDLYGFLPPLAGLVEGILFGYWASVIEKS